MARAMLDTTEIYRAEVKYHWVDDDEERIAYYGPYEGSNGKSQARRRTKDQYHSSLIIEAKVQKLTCAHDGNGPDLQWVDVDG